MASRMPGAGHRGVCERAVRPFGLGTRRVNWPVPDGYRTRQVRPPPGGRLAGDSRPSRRTTDASPHPRGVRRSSRSATNRSLLVSHRPATVAPDPTGVAWLDAARVWLARFPLSIIQLAGRIGVGATFFRAGLLKYQSW